MKKKRIIIALVALALVGASAGGYVLLRSRAASASRAGSGARSSVYTVIARDVATSTTVSGTIHPVRTSTVASRASGTITAVYKHVGDKVAAGDVIARIDDTEYQKTLAAAESRYRSTMINLEMSETTDLAAVKTQLENAVRQAQAQLYSAELNLRDGSDTESDEQTIANLQDQVTDAEQNLADAQANLKEAQQGEAEQLQLLQTDFEVRQAEFNLGMAQTKLATLKAQTVTDDQLATLQSQVRQAKATLLSAQTSLTEAAASSTTTDARLALLQSQVDEAQIALAKAQDNLANAPEDYAATQDEIDAQALAVENAQLALMNAESAYEKAKASVDTQATLTAAQLAVTKAQRALATAQANLAAGRKTIAGKTTNVEILKSNVEQAKASLATAQANLAAYPVTVQKAELQEQSNEEAKQQALSTLNETRELAEDYVIAAPWAGIVTALNVQVGDTVTASTGVATVADASSWYVSAYVDEVDILNVKVGQDASVTIDEYSTPLSGTVSYVSYALGTTSQSVSAYPIRVTLTDPPATIVDGMSADAAVTVSIVKGVLAVPTAAVSTSNGKTYVDVVTVGADKTVTTSRVEVKTGTEGDEYTEVKSGLKAGDRVLRTASTSAASTTSTTDTNTGDTDILDGFNGGAGGPPDGGAGGPPGGGTFTPPSGGD